MSIYSFQNDNQNKNQDNNSEEPRKRALRMIMLMYIGLNGIVTGRFISTSMDIVKGQRDNSLFLAAVFYIGVMAYTGQRIYEIYRELNNKNNHKGR